MRLLIVEDDADLGRILKKHFEANGYAVETFRRGEEAVGCLTENCAFDAAVLDVMLPGISGLDVLRSARKAGCRIPVLLLTARGAVRDRVEGLDAGADDYMAKPFSNEELDARVRALIRRGPSARDNVLTAADLVLDSATREVRRGGKPIELSSREFSLLEYLMHNKGIVLTREQLEMHIWNANTRSASNVVDVYIRYLRRKIDDDYEVKLIHTIRGAGYRLSEKP